MYCGLLRRVRLKRDALASRALAFAAHAVLWLSTRTKLLYCWVGLDSWEVCRGLACVVRAKCDTLAIWKLSSAARAVCGPRGKQNRCTAAFVHGSGGPDAGPSLGGGRGVPLPHPWGCAPLRFCCIVCLWPRTQVRAVDDPGPGWVGTGGGVDRGVSSLDVFGCEKYWVLEIGTRVRVVS